MFFFPYFPIALTETDEHPPNKPTTTTNERKRKETNEEYLSVLHPPSSISKGKFFSNWNTHYYFRKCDKQQKRKWDKQQQRKWDKQPQPKWDKQKKYLKRIGLMRLKWRRENWVLWFKKPSSRKLIFLSKLLSCSSV